MTKLRPLKILFTASEATPFAKEGGLADVAGSLPKALAAAGHDVRMVMPRYYRIDRTKLHPVPGALSLPMGQAGQHWGRFFEGQLPGSSVPVYFLDHEDYFGRDSLYQENGEGFADNDQRFIFFSKASLELCKLIDFTPDVIHVHDWHTSAIPVLLNTLYRHDPWVGEAASLLTLHNMQHQGNFPKEAMNLLGIDWAHFNHLELEAHDRVNLLKGGIYHATLLNTVSRGYAMEIQTPEHGFGLDGVLRERREDLHGILNGVDYQEWNPETDPLIPAHFDRLNLSGKARCKEILQQEMGLPQKPDVPLIGFVGRLMKQKGVDLLAEAMPKLMELDIQIVLLGNGEPWSHFYFGDMAAQFPDKFACRIGFDNRLAHRIEAGSDLFLMPSRFEPCGLNQMYSMAYGTLPIVRACGGLDDSVENFDETTGSGTGFKFQDVTAGALFDTVGWAVHTYYNRPEAFHRLIRQAMAKRFSWEESGKAYYELYLKAIDRKRG